MTTFIELEKKMNSLSSVGEKAYSLFEFWLANRGRYINEVKECLEAIKLEAQREGSSYALGWVYYLWGWIESDQGNFSASFPFLEIAKEKFEECGDKWALSNTMNGFAVNYSHLGVYDKALENYLVALELAEGAKDGRLVTSIAFNIGSVFSQLNQYSEALYYFEEVALDFSHVPSEKAIMLCNFGRAYKFLGRYTEALEKFDEAIELNRGGIGEVFAYQEIASVLRLQKQDDLAYEYYQKCLEMARKLKLSTFIGSTLFNLGTFEKEKGQIKLAQKYLEEALIVSEMSKSEAYRALNLKELAEIYKEIGRVDEAYNYLNEVIKYQSKAFNEELVNNIGILKIKQARRENLIYRDLYNRINTISSIGRAITASLNIEEVGLVVYEQLNELLPADNLLIGLYEEENEEVNYRIIIKDGLEAHGFMKDLTEKNTAESRCLENQKGIIVNDLSEIGLVESKDYALKGIKSLVCCPLVLRDKVLGFIVVQSKKLDVYSDYHLDILNALAAYLVIALENGKLFSDVQKLATTDHLTGLANRRCILAEASKAFANSIRYALPLSIILADLDHFKTINDSFGHDVGDQVLKETARIFLENIREVDLVGRVGGEEFLFILPNIALEEGETLANRLCAALKEFQCALLPKDFKVTASFGLTEVLEKDCSIEDAIKRADEAQYQAKEEGRDRVVVASLI